MLNTINLYKLDTHLDDYPEGSFLPLSQATYNFFDKYFGIKRMFKKEEFYYPRNQILFQRECPNSLIATIDKKIYKIYYHFLTRNNDDYNELRNLIFDHLGQYMTLEKLGNPQIQDVLAQGNPLVPEPTNVRLLIWQFDWGNLILEIANAGVSYIITSSSVRPRTKGFLDNLFK